jgi:DNA helicase-2/ATP-dependent DNA helicase PcrA
MTPAAITLNPEQKAAVEFLGDPLLIIAGAGTGKTRVITERIAFLLDHGEGLHPENIVALTFTRRATEEMSTRIRERLGETHSGSVHVHTFHSFALQLVRDQSARLNRQSEPQLLDEFDFWILLRRNIEKLNLEVFWKNAEPGKFLKDLIEFMSRAHDELVSVADYEAYVERLSQNLRSQIDSGDLPAAVFEEKMKAEREIARVYRVATGLLAEAGAQTFGNVIATAVRLLRDFPDVREHCQNRFRAILVDEFQDTNVAQIELLDLLAQAHQNITVVGDDDQGIYRFRGASSESFTMFARKFPRFAQKKLTQNYRSTQRILRVANELIAVNPDRFDPQKDLWTKKPEGEPVTLVEAPEPDDEALAVAGVIERLRAQGRALQDIAVLYRAHSHRDLLVRVLRQRCIPFQVVGLSVLGHSSVRDLLSLARFLTKSSDNIACARTMTLPHWELSESEFVTLSHRAAQHPHRDVNTGRPTLYEIVQESSQKGEAGDLRPRLMRFVEWTESLRALALERPAIATIKILVAELRSTRPKQERLPDVSEFRRDEVERPVLRVIEFVEEWQRRNADAPVKEFLEYFDLYLEAGGDITEDEKRLQSADAVRLMTVHAAKGLEFPTVFVLRLTQNYFPSKKRTSLLPFPESLRKEGALPPSDAHTYEERRLCYVALTRAQEKLVLTSVVKSRWKPSAFLGDMQRNKELAGRDMVGMVVPRSDEKLADQVWLDPNADERAYRNSRIPLWALRNRPVAAEPDDLSDALQLSASSMEAFQTCPMKYKWGHVYKLSGGPSAALTFGAVMHECVKHFFIWKQQDGTFPVERMEEFLGDRWRSIGFEDAYQEERYRVSALEQLRRFYEKNIHPDVTILAQEAWFKFQLGDVMIRGRIDQMNEEPGGAVELIDYKTGRAKEQQDADKSLQLSVYALAGHEFFHRPPTRLAFYNLINGEKVITERTATALEFDRELIAQIARDIRQRRFPPKKNYFCSQCFFLQVCPAWEEV